MAENVKITDEQEAALAETRLSWSRRLRLLWVTLKTSLPCRLVRSGTNFNSLRSRSSQICAAE